MYVRFDYEGNNLALSTKIATNKINEVLRAYSAYFIGFAEWLRHGVEHSVCEASF